MVKLLTAALVALLAWSGWWWLGATAHQKGWELWLADRQDAGWVAEYADLSVSGYPNRIDTTLTDLQLADPASGWAWTAPVFQVLSLSYKPNHVIAVWPGPQTVSSPDGTAQIAGDRLRGSLVFVPETDLRLDRLQLETEGLTVTGPDWDLALAAANIAARRAPDATAPANSYDFAVDIRALSLPAITKTVLDPASILPDVFETATLNMTVAYDAAWDRHAVEGRKPQPEAISLKSLKLVWGQLSLDMRGKIDVDRAGYPVGDLTIKARNWRDILNVAVAGGLMPQSLADSLKTGLGLLAGLSGDPRSIDIPLTFADQMVSLGPIQLGPAPRLRTD